MQPLHRPGYYSGIVAPCGGLFYFINVSKTQHTIPAPAKSKTGIEITKKILSIVSISLPRDSRHHLPLQSLSHSATALVYFCSSVFAFS